MTQRAEGPLRQGLCQAVLKSGKPRTPPGGGRAPGLRLPPLAQERHHRMVGTGACQHPRAERLARQEPRRVE
jgi:hypothetical protein